MILPPFTLTPSLFFPSPIFVGVVESPAELAAARLPCPIAWVAAFVSSVGDSELPKLELDAEAEVPPPAAVSESLRVVGAAAVVT